MTNIEIDYLFNKRIFIPTIAEWFKEQWGYLSPMTTMDERIEKINSRCGINLIPITMVALESCDILGTASLVEFDMIIRKNLSPWLAIVYVNKKARRLGIGSALVNRIIIEAKKIGHTKLYLFTPNMQEFYSRNGWKIFEELEYRNEMVTIMYIDL